MAFSQQILLVLLLGVYAQANETNLATNTNILLILLLALSASNTNSTCNNTTSCCSGNIF